MTLFERDAAHIAGTYARYPLEITGGEGSLLYGADGGEYIDFTAGIGVNIFGTRDPAWLAAVTEQLGKFQHTSNLYYTEPAIRLAEELCRRTGAGKVFFSNSGAEANECAIKAARLYGEATGRYRILTLEWSFHGRTLATLAATGQERFHRHFNPLPDGFVTVAANDIDALRAAVLKEDPVALMLETVRGEGGVLPLDPEFLSAAAELCRERDMLLIIDEVQTGNGRTGALYSYQKRGLEPDIVTTAKGLGGGLPIGATLFWGRTEGLFTPGSHGSTFGGNPVACAGAYNIVQRLDEKLFAEVEEKSAYIKRELASSPGVTEVRGEGLMLGVSTRRSADAVINECLRRGLLVLKAGDSVRLLPPLNIPGELLERGVSILKECTLK